MKQSNALKHWSLGVKNATWWDVFKAHVFMVFTGISLWAFVTGMVLWVWIF